MTATEALESLRGEILDWRENALKKLPKAGVFDRPIIDGRTDAYLWVVEEIDKRLERLFDDGDTERKETASHD